MAAWVSGAQFNKGRGYKCTVQFPEACSITVGTPVRVSLSVHIKMKPISAGTLTSTISLSYQNPKEDVERAYRPCLADDRVSSAL